jgi:uncharacterized protein (TIRG00374 family)
VSSKIAPSRPTPQRATPKSNLVARFRKWVVIAIAVGALLYLGGAVAADLDKVSESLERFQWSILVPVCGLTFLNYGLRFAKWHYLLRRLGVNMPLGEDVLNFTAGLAMVISPGKAGELLKPYVVRARTGVPMATTIPALVTERLTDGIAMLILAGISVSVYAADKVHYLTIPAALIGGGLLVLAHEGLSLWSVRMLSKVPGLRGVADSMEEMLISLRRCVAPWPLLLTLVLSIIAWAAECYGYQLVFRGLGYPDVDLGVAVFLYAFATVAGAAMPGGLGVADGVLAGGAVALIPGISQSVSVAAAILIRVCTLWIGVAIGAVALLRVSTMLGGIALERDEAEE